MTQEQANTLSYNPFDITKVWRFEEFPFIEIGTFTLDRNPTDYFSQVEQAAFNPGNLVPGIDLSPDPVLTARAFAYKNAQRYRIGPNFEEIDVNRPISKVQSYQRDGVMRVSAKDNGNGGPNYFPNSFHGPGIDPATQLLPSLSVTGYISRDDTTAQDNFSHPRAFLNRDITSDEERARMAGRMAEQLAQVLPPLRARVLTNCIYPIGREFGDAVVWALERIEASESGNLLRNSEQQNGNLTSLII
jgi:catalase